MKKTLISTMLVSSLLLGVALPTLAQSPVATQPGIDVEATTIRSAKLNRELARKFAGVYELSNGERVQFMRQGIKIVAFNADGTSVEMIATANDKLISATGRTEVRFSAADAVERVTIIARRIEPLLASAGNSVEQAVTQIV